MKILYVITRAERGGAQVHLIDLVRSLPNGCEAVIVTGESGFLTEEAFILGIRIRIVPNLVQPISPLKDLAALWSLIQVIREEEPQLVHAHTSKAGLLGRLAAFMTGTPAVFTAHTWSFMEGVSWPRRSIALPIERLVAKLSPRIINVSKANLRIAAREGIGDEDRLLCIWNGVPDVPFRAQPGRESVTTLVMTARFVPQKDYLTLVQALTGVTGNWRALFVGGGPAQLSVREAVERNGLCDQVVFTGNRSDIPQILAGADIFVLATKWEGLPLSILEAMRAGLPVVATAVGGVAEAVEDGVNGFIVPPLNASALRAGIQSLVSSRELQQQMGAASRKRYEADFRLDQMTQKTLAVYHEVVKEDQCRYPRLRSVTRL